MPITIRKTELVNKIWGYEDIIVNRPDLGYCGKVMKLYRGFQSSLHYHPVKNETMFVLEGTMYIESPRDHLRQVSVGDVIDIPANTEHRFISVGEPCTFIEFSQPHDDADVVRIEDSRSI